VLIQNDLLYETFYKLDFLITLLGSWTWS